MGGVRTPLLVRLAHEQDRGHRDASFFQHRFRELDVLARVRCARLQEHSGVRHSELQCPLSVVDGFTTRHARPGRGAGRPREDDDWRHALVVQLCRHISHAEVVTAQTYGHRTGPRVVTHAVVVPQQAGVCPHLFRDRDAEWTPTANSTTVPSAVYVVRCSSTTATEPLSCDRFRIRRRKGLGIRRHGQQSLAEGRPCAPERPGDPRHT